MCFHFVNQYGNSRAVPQMLLSTHNGGLAPAGTFWFFAAITVLGFFFAWFFIPETAGLSLESMDALFKLRWYQIGRMGRAQAKVEEQREIERVIQEKEGTSVAYQVETSEKRDERV